FWPHEPPRSCEKPPEPMQLGRFRLSEKERQRRAQLHLCFYCWQTGHLINRCPETSSKSQVTIDRFRAAVNLIDSKLVRTLCLPTIPCTPHLCIISIDSQPIGGVYFTHQAGFFFIGKKDGGLHPCVDYWGLNAIMVRYPYPLPLVPAALEQLREAIFTKLYLRSAYNLIRIREWDEWKTAFHTTSGHYEYLVMPYGLTNAPAVFQSLINEVFKDVLNKYVIAYIDDILIYSSSMTEHIQHVCTMLTRLLTHHLYIKAEKSEFHRSSITFLGYVISQQAVEMDQAKVLAVTGWPEPDTIKELQCFLGFANFYR
ncbi:hypothetical protein QTP70_031231, partial [Hemibagrus guttatus]